MKVSICVPTYGMKGLGSYYLQRNFSSIILQSLVPYEIVVSDHSTDDEIENLCKSWEKFLNIRYFRNKVGVGNISSNLNNCLEKAEGDIIDFMLQDDYYFAPNSLEKRINFLVNSNSHWSVSATIHYSVEKKEFYWHLIPTYRNDIYLGYNSIGSPSLLTMKRENSPRFDENLVMLTDCDYYKQLFDKFGLPFCSPDITSVSCMWEGQTQRKISTDNVQEEVKKVKLKYE